MLQKLKHKKTLAQKLERSDINVKNEDIIDRIIMPLFIKKRDINPDCTVLLGPVLLSSVPFTPSP